MTYKEEVQILIERNLAIQAFDRAFSAYLENDIPDFQRDNTRKTLLQKTLIVVAGAKWEQLDTIKDITEFCLEFLKLSVPFEKRKDVIASLLRLLATPRVDWIDDKRWRAPIIEFIRDNVDREIFTKHWKISLDGQSHETMTNLRAKSKELFDEFEKAANRLQGIEHLSSIQNGLLSSIRKPTGQLAVASFLPTNIDVLLKDVYSSAEAYYKDRESIEAFDLFEEVVHKTEQLIRCTKEFQTSLSVMISEKTGLKLQDLIITDFDNNKAAQPANLEIQERDKKYPFHLGEFETRVGLTINNKGPGFANNVHLDFVGLDSIEIAQNTGKIRLGRLSPNTFQNIDIPIRVKRPVNTADIICSLSWENFDKSPQERCVDFRLTAQRDNTDWNSLSQLEPYSLGPVLTEDKLVGRKDVLDRLMGIFSAQQIGSSIISGQKRVGKTSIAKVLMSRLEQKGYSVLYLEAGTYVDPNADKTIEKLGQALCRAMRRSDSRLKNIVTPEFENAFSSISDFLNDVEDITPDKKVVVILDEFDELPPELYGRNSIGNSFFLTLRAISSRGWFGFLLVGGEKMKHIVSFQGAQLNKWATFEVDYFSRDTDWSDYRELIERPVRGYIDYTDEAIIRLHELTAGNPYFTKLICGFVYQHATEKRDCYVTVDEISIAVRVASENLAANTFQHFWDDGIYEFGSGKADEKSLRRRRVLIALADVLEEHKIATRELISAHEIVKHVDYVDGELKEFQSRDVILYDRQSQCYVFKVSLFFDWLKVRGIRELISTFEYLDNALKQLEAQETKRVTTTELNELVGRWSIYRGQKITTDHVRQWLEQFRGPKEQRLMFQLLSKLEFYSEALVREKLKVIENIVRRDTTRKIEPGKRRRDDILVSYLDHIGKSGAQLGHWYADETGVYVDNVVEKHQIASYLSENDNIQVIVFVDDIVGTGGSVETYLGQLLDQLKVLENNRSVTTKDIKIVFAAIVAFRDGWSRIQEVVESYPMNIALHTCTILDKKSQCFSEESQIFLDPDERESARKLALEFGRKLEKKYPLGFGDLELAVVFEHNCPNNTLPIIWKESTGQFEWKPLFKRG